MILSCDTCQLANLSRSSTSRCWRFGRRLLIQNLSHVCHRAVTPSACQTRLSRATHRSHATSVPWHKDITCAEYAAKDVDEKMSDPEKDTLKLMQSRDGKRCPNCQLVIEKDGGCDSMVRLPYVLAEHDSQLTPYLVLCRLPQVLQLGQRRLSNNRRQETRSTIPPQHALLAERRTSDLRDGRYSGTRRHGDG
jgi:hypothetical protein